MSIENKKLLLLQQSLGAGRGKSGHCLLPGADSTMKVRCAHYFCLCCCQITQ